MDKFVIKLDGSVMLAIERALKEAQFVTNTGSATQRPPSPAPVSISENGLAFIKAASGSGFRFGKSSEKELLGVLAPLVEVVRLALSLSTQDFIVFDGLRTKEEQAEHVRKGTSRTMNSKHLQGLAVDLVPWIGGKPVWDWDGCYKIAYAMDQAATQLDCADQIRWGGAWDRTLVDFGGNASAYSKEVELYRSRHAGPDFIDGPHFEWVS